MARVLAKRRVYQRLPENGNTDPEFIDRIFSKVPSMIQDLQEAAKPTSRLYLALEMLATGKGIHSRLDARASKRGTKGGWSVTEPIGRKSEHAACGMSMWTGRSFPSSFNHFRNVRRVVTTPEASLFSNPYSTAVMLTPYVTIGAISSLRASTPGWKISTRSLFDT